MKLRDASQRDDGQMLPAAVVRHAQLEHGSSSSPGRACGPTRRVQWQVGQGALAHNRARHRASWWLYGALMRSGEGALPCDPRVNPPGRGRWARAGSTFRDTWP